MTCESKYLLLFRNSQKHMVSELSALILQSFPIFISSIIEMS